MNLFSDISVLLKSAYYLFVLLKFIMLILYLNLIGATLYILISSYVDKNLTAKKNFLFESTLTSKITFKQPTTK